MDRNHLLRSGIAGCSGQGHDTYVFKRREELLVNRTDVALSYRRPTLLLFLLLLVVSHSYFFRKQLVITSFNLL